MRGYRVLSLESWRAGISRRYFPRYLPHEPSSDACRTGVFVEMLNGNSEDPQIFRPPDTGPTLVVTLSDLSASESRSGSWSGFGSPGKVSPPKCRPPTDGRRGVASWKGPSSHIRPKAGRRLGGLILPPSVDEDRNSLEEPGDGLRQVTSPESRSRSWGPSVRSTRRWCQTIHISWAAPLIPQKHDRRPELPVAQLMKACYGSPCAPFAHASSIPAPSC